MFTNMIPYVLMFVIRWRTISLAYSYLFILLYCIKYSLVIYLPQCYSLNNYTLQPRPVRWLNGVGGQKAPPDVPMCGFDGELCEDPKESKYMQFKLLYT